MSPPDSAPQSAPDASPAALATEGSAGPIDSIARAKLGFPVVGIGASAGGVEALRTFFESASPDSGLAYVVIQHLSPEHGSLMAEILGRCTKMPVRQIEEGTKVEPNHVYVIRPGRTVTLDADILHLGEPVEKRGHRHPVDDFFRSLAREQKDSAIAVVLSGTGTNGTAGAQAIKAEGGLCIAQDPETAEFPGMPQSLINAGYADQVLPTQDIPAILQRYAEHPSLERDPAGNSPAARELEHHRQQLSEILAIVRARTGRDFAPYKTGTVLRRIQRRLGLLGLSVLEDYSSRLREDSAEVTALVNDLMINVTGFFRDPEVWEALREVVVRPLVQEARGPIRAWVTACASGEEPYSLAMLIAEEAEQAGMSPEVKIFATDTADKSLALARAGVYSGGIEGDLSTERLDRFFEKGEHTYRIKKTLRDQVVFAPQDLLRDPPFSRLHIVTCRNLLIYLEPEAQRRVLTLLHFALREGGYLILGSAESLGHAETLFEVVSKRWRIYRRRASAENRVVDLPALPPRPFGITPNVHDPLPLSARPSGGVPVQAALLEAFGPPTAVVDVNERVVYFHGHVAPFLKPPAGEITQNLIEMVHVSLRPATRSALRQAIAERRCATVQTDCSEAGAERIAVVAAPVNVGSTEHFRVSFVSLPKDDAGPGLSSGAAAVVRLGPKDPVLEEELRDLRRELQTTVEAFEASTEELKASNEEGISINEELQSSNEELETSKEELQSVNEELLTVNGQLQTKLVELEALNNDLDNLLSSTDIAVVFLDPELNVRRFTPAISDLLELLPADIGRPLAHLAQKFTDGNLIADASQVIAKLVPLESEVLSHSGRWYIRRTLPYRTDDNRVAGVVITFIDISTRKQATQAVEAERAHLRAVIEHMPTAVLLIEAPSGKLLFANRQAATLFNQPFPVPCIGYEWTAIYSAFQGTHANQLAYEPHEWPLARALATGEVVRDEELEFLRLDGSRAIVSMSAAPVRNSVGAAVAAVAAFWDVTDRKAADEHLQETLRSAQQLRATAERANLAKDEFISTVSHELRTPLNTIRLWSRMFASGAVHERDVVEGGKMVDRAALAQQQLIDDLLDVSRMATGQLRLARRDAVLISVLEAALDAVRPLAVNRQITLTAELSPEIGTVNIDPDRIQQIMWNLLANAVKFTPDGGRVEVRSRRHEGTVEIEVIDSGAGIRPEFLPHVFDRFRQGDMGTARRYAGLGLGLAIAKQLAELHGGTITALSEGEGRGAKFTVYLPLEKRQRIAESEQIADFSGREDLRGIEVLLVEDDSLAREATARLLEQAGAQVRSVDSAARARSALAARRPDIIVGDIGMAEEDGYSLLASIRRTEEEQGLPRIPAIAVTAFARSEDRQRALATGFDEHLPKPLDPKRLVYTVARMAPSPSRGGANQFKPMN